MARFSFIVCALACILLAAPASASAAPFMASVMQDDNQLAYGTPSQRRAALDLMKTLGVDAVRVTLLWRAVAPTKPRKGADPRSYRVSLWDNYDDLVVQAARRGLIVYLNPTGPGDSWAHARAPRPEDRASWRPNAKEFAKFVEAAGRRYSGAWRDENQGRLLLPRVAWWSIWNEPNQAGWLMPQGQRMRGVRGLVASSPHLYRELLVAGARGLARSGHKDDLVLIGETAPLGEQRAKGARPPLRPGLFLRELFCLDGRLRPFRGRQASARGCASMAGLDVLEQFTQLGFGHHPYTKKLAPNKREKGRDAITIANIGELPKLLDRIAARTKLLPPDMPVFLTEYGYETQPPDPYSGIPLALQAQYLNEGDRLAWLHPRVFANTQFQLFDVPPQTAFPHNSKPYWFTYQSGLFTADKKPKPAAQAYAFPLVVERSGGTARIWGQVRFGSNGAKQTVLLQFKAPGSNNWVRSGDVLQVTNNQGYFEATRPTQAGATWRAVWLEPDFQRSQLSREVKLG